MSFRLPLATVLLATSLTPAAAGPVDEDLRTRALILRAEDLRDSEDAVLRRHSSPDRPAAIRQPCLRHCEPNE